ncbi:hypothetical protein ACFFRR_009874 [Megaselia abdita]
MDNIGGDKDTSVSNTKNSVSSNANIDIYSINEDLVKTLAGMNKIHVSSSAFYRLTESFQKVKFAEDLLLKFEHLQKFKLKLVMQNCKTNEKSIAFRKEGNENFSLKSRNYFRALQLYNKSICYSLCDSENIAIGYANRSAVLFELKKYQQCLENITMARNANFPERLMHKLDKRENDCKKLLSSQAPEVEPYEFPLSFEKHQDVPYISNCLAMDQTEDEGRFVYTKTDLKPGDIVAIEDPYCTTLLPAMKYIRCAYCTKENCFSLIPCNNCTSAMFCSESCRDKAWDVFHKYECPVIDFLFDTCTKIHLTALRTCLTTLSLFASVEECRAFCEDPDNQSKTVFDLNFNEFTKIEEYKAVHGLVTNQDKRLVNDLFQRAVMCATIKNILIEYTPLKTLLGESIENHNFFADLLFKHLQTASSNMHSIDLIEQVSETKEDECFATGAYPFLSLLNHSCAPNVVRIHRSTTTILFVLRHIEANEKLFDNYGFMKTCVLTFENPRVVQ